MSNTQKSRTYEEITLKDKTIQEYYLDQLRNHNYEPSLFVKKQLHIYKVIKNQLYNVMNSNEMNISRE